MKSPHRISPLTLLALASIGIIAIATWQIMQSRPVDPAILKQPPRATR